LAAEYRQSSLGRCHSWQRFINCGTELASDLDVKMPLPFFPQFAANYDALHTFHTRGHPRCRSVG
ncbi:MAG: hypothetical protein AAGB13_20365, partial [Cyanobacteria bacterium P01_F01_bin.33]